ncbi:hypothetical protein [Nocardia otitidiscaviarum]|uniref:hypothetical protein n=1 Tax=Nocardia otitidiscaviarum TaxID=1823 RepID=UPI002454971A|nr:hypothetical protein [Nocardia otitidiscaviarum]
MPEPEPIQVSPLELWRRLHATQNHFADLLHEVSEIRREYERLRAHPTALAVDGLGPAVDPVKTTDAVLHGLEQTTGGLQSAHDRLESTRADHAMRLKLTDAAARELGQRRQRRATRSR